MLSLSAVSALSNRSVSRKDCCALGKVLSYAPTAPVLPPGNPELEQQKERIQKQYAEATRNHMLTTGYNFEGYTISKYHGLVSGECVLGSGLISYFEASIANTLGTETSGYSEKMRNAKQLAIEDMIRQSVALGGNSIIGISYSISNLLSNMVGISVDGTSVTIEKNQISTNLED